MRDVPEIGGGPGDVDSQDPGPPKGRPGVWGLGLGGGLPAGSKGFVGERIHGGLFLVRSVCEGASEWVGE